MGQPKISVIVPVYNVEQYLCQCIDSILSQSYRNFELLLINDGSKDNSGKICDEYAERDDRIRVFHAENGGVSKARNLGLDYAKGDYVCFVDSDDWIDKDVFSCVESNMKNADIVQFGFRKINGSIIEDSNVPKNILELSTLDYCYLHLYHPAVCGYIVKLDIINNNKIAFPVGIKYGEDQALILKTLMCSSKIIVLDRHFYNYRIREGSAMNTSLSLSMGKDHLLAVENVLHFMYSKGIEMTPLYLRVFRSFVISYLGVSVRCVKKKAEIRDVKKVYSEFLRATIFYKTCPIYFRMFDSYFFIASYYGYVKMKNKSVFGV